MTTAEPLEVAIIGGGHRDLSICRALAAMRAVRRVHLVSQRGARGMQEWIAAEGLTGRVTLHGKVDPVLWNAGIPSAVVANRPEEHFATARWLLENGKHVLVERPFVASGAEARTLIDMAEARRLVLAANLEYFFASYLHYFRSVVHNQGHPHPVERTTLVWHETAPAPARGGPGPLDAARATARLMPDVLTVLTVLFGRHAARVVGGSAGAVGGETRWRIAYGPHDVDVSLWSGAPAARREVEVATVSGRTFALNFTEEPGTVCEDGRALPADLLWDVLPRPLPAGLASFLDETRSRQGTLPLLARDTLHVVEGAGAAVARARDALDGRPDPGPGGRYAVVPRAAQAAHGLQESR